MWKFILKGFGQFVQNRKFDEIDKRNNKYVASTKPGKVSLKLTCAFYDKHAMFCTICCTRAQQPKFTDSTHCQYQDSTDDEDRRCDIVNTNVQSVIVVPLSICSVFYRA